MVWVDGKAMAVQGKDLRRLQLNGAKEVETVVESSKGSCDKESESVPKTGEGPSPRSLTIHRDRNSKGCQMTRKPA